MIRAEAAAAAAAEGGSRESGELSVVKCNVIWCTAYLSSHVTRHLFMWMYTLYSESNTLYCNTTHLVLEFFSCLKI